MTGGVDEVVLLAMNLACNRGYAVFPCREDKRPACPHGFKEATTDPDRITALWQRRPGPLIGIATGAASGISVLDVDVKHAEAVLWWQGNHHRLLPTRTLATRSNGLHLYFQHREGVTSSQGKIAKGIDTRGQGGYVISWFAAGFACHDPSPPVPWPPWLLNELTWRPPAPPQPRSTARPPDLGRAIDGIVRNLTEAPEGERNGRLFWAACRCGERGLPRHEIEALLIPIAKTIGLTDVEARRTITSAQGRAVA